MMYTGTTAIVAKAAVALAPIDNGTTSGGGGGGTGGGGAGVKKAATLSEVLELPQHSAEELERRLQRLQNRLSNAINTYKSKILTLPRPEVATTSMTLRNTISGRPVLESTSSVPSTNSTTATADATPSSLLSPHVDIPGVPAASSGIISPTTGLQSPLVVSSPMCRVDMDFLEDVGPAYTAGYRSSQPTPEDLCVTDYRMYQLLETVSRRLQDARQKLNQLNRVGRGNFSDGFSCGVRSNVAPTAAISLSTASALTSMANATAIGIASMRGGGGSGPLNVRAQLKEIGNLLWLAQVDLENVEDMFAVRLRPTMNGANKIGLQVSQKLHEVNGRLNEEFSKFGDMVKHLFRTDPAATVAAASATLRPR